MGTFVGLDMSLKETSACILDAGVRGQGGVGASPNEWAEVNRFDTVTVAARRIRELEGYPVALEA